MNTKDPVARAVVTVLAVYLIAITALLLWALAQLADLKHEKEAHNWRYFTCRTLLDDPQTRAIMGSKWRVEDAQLACKRAERKAAQQSTSSSIATSD